MRSGRRIKLRRFGPFGVVRPPDQTDPGRTVYAYDVFEIIKLHQHLYCETRFRVTMTGANEPSGLTRRGVLSAIGGGGVVAAGVGGIPSDVRAAQTVDTCPPVSADLSSGYDQAGGTLVNYEASDDDWRIVTDTTEAGAVPRAATVVAEETVNDGWPVPFDGSRWIAHQADARIAEAGQTITYEYCFCLNDGFTGPILSLTAKADDEIADVRLNGRSLGYDARGGRDTPVQQQYWNRSLFQTGQNCLQIEVRNTEATFSGLNVSATLDVKNADCACDPGSCPSVAYDLASGYDQVNGTTLDGDTDDDDWQIVDETTNWGSVPRPATVVVQKIVDDHWNPPEPGSKWIAHRDSAGSVRGQSVTYEYCFCLNEGFTNPVLSLTAKADDEIADVRLNGQSLAYAARGGLWSPIDQTYTDPGPFQEGQNCVQIDVRDDGGYVSGVNVSASVEADEADCSCPSPDCSNVSEPLATGYNDLYGLQDDAANDDDWAIVADSGSNDVPRPGTVVREGLVSVYWPAPFDGSRWIGHNADGSPVDEGREFVYEYCFCLADGFDDPSLELSAMADDEITSLTLNGTELPRSALGSVDDPIEQGYDDPRRFQAGKNCLRVTVTDRGGDAAGLNLVGELNARDADCNCFQDGTVTDGPDDPTA